MSNFPTSPSDPVGTGIASFFSVLLAITMSEKDNEVKESSRSTSS